MRPRCMSHNALLNNMADCLRNGRQKRRYLFHWQTMEGQCIHVNKKANSVVFRDASKTMYDLPEQELTPKKVCIFN